MMPEATLDDKDPWEAPPAELDPELIETSQRLVSLSEGVFSPKIDPIEGAMPDPQLVELETRNQYLFERNVALVAKVAQLETANLRLQEEVSALRQASRTQPPWYLRWFQPSA
jgi:hypothetical protein